MRNLYPRVGWMLAGVLALYVLSALAGAASGGSLDPPGLPGSTMKSLADVPPSWHQTLPSDDGDVDGCNSTRFTCVMGGTAFLDNETGLVWERNPNGLSNHWTDAFNHCRGQFTGGRQGWRVPAAQELSSLRDDSADFLPDGAPFPSVETLFWTATLGFSDPDDVIALNLDDNGFVGLSKTESADLAIWCVRGPQPASPTGGPP